MRTVGKIYKDENVNNVKKETDKIDNNEIVNNDISESDKITKSSVRNPSAVTPRRK